jgi:hypothetical protein
MVFSLQVRINERMLRRAADLGWNTKNLSSVAWVLFDTIAASHNNPAMPIFVIPRKNGTTDGCRGDERI